jgi:glycosyltransferase involved in cell wall biosynthesis
LIIQDNISVIITTYNSSDCIEKAIQSVIKQCDVTTEIIIVDDCSNDYSALKLNAESYFQDCLITILQPDEKGNANVSRNIGIQTAQYPYVAFLDADDTWNEQHLISCLSTMREQSLDACFGRVNLIAGQRVTKSTPIYKSQSDICDFIFVQGGISVTSSFVIAKQTLADITFNNKLFKHQDWDFLVRYTSKYKLGQSAYYGLNYTLSTGTNMSSKFNFDASVRFMNETLPTPWHCKFITSSISKIVNEKRYNDLVSLREKLHEKYKKPVQLLGVQNNLIISSAKNKMLFHTIAYSFQMLNSVKSKIRLFLT